MTYDEIPPAFRVALGAHEAYRRFGFPSEFIGLRKDHMVIYVVRDQGLEFVFECGTMNVKHAVFERRWKEMLIADGWRVPADRIWQEFLVNTSLVEFMARLTAKGFVLHIGKG